MDPFVVALAVALATPPVMLAPPTTEVERIYVQGQDEYEARDYATAARTWTGLLEVLPESGDNRAIRESVLINVLDAHLRAYNLLLRDDGKKNIEHLHEAEATLGAYYAAFKAEYGDRVAMSNSVREKADEIEDAVRAAQVKPKVPRPAPYPPPPPPPPPPLVPERAGNGLIIAGSVTAAAGLAAVAMIAVGSMRGRTESRRFDDAQARLTIDMTDVQAFDDRATAQRNGELANAILIAGAVITPLLLAGGATMIALGVRKKKRRELLTFRF